MKILKIVLISLLALVVLLIAAAVIVINTIDVNKFKPQIVDQASKALARRVDFKSARASIGFNGVGLKISGLAIGEDPAFGGGEFLTVDSVSVGVDVLGYLLRRQVSVTGIVIDAPRISVIRAKNGAINAQSIAKAPEAGTGQVPSAAAPADVPALLISSLKGRNGTVRYVDHSFEPPLTVEARDVAFTADRLSLTDPFPFSVQAAVVSDGQNIRVDGRCQIDLKNSSARVFDLTASSDLSRLSLKTIPQSLPMIPAQAMPSELKGNVELRVPELKAGASGLAGLKADAQLSGGLAKFREMAVPVGDIRAKAAVTEKDITVESVSAAVGQGSVNAGGWIKDYQAAQEYSFDLSARKLDVAELVAQEQLPVKAQGLVSARGKIGGKGFTPEALRTTLAGDGVVEVTGAALKGLNVFKMALDSLNAVPGLGDSVEASLPAKYAQKLQQKDTAFSDFTLPVTVAEGRVRIGDTSISSEDLFIFKGKGEAGFDGSYSLEGALLIPAELSGIIVGKVKQMEYLRNAQQLIEIPLRVSGTAGAKMQFTVDTGYITRKLVENQARQQIMKGLDKYLGGQDAQQQNQPAGQGQGSQPQPQNSTRSDAEKAVDKLLNNLFR